MSATVKRTPSRQLEGPLSAEDEAEKVKALREAIGPQTGRAAIYCSDDCLHRFLVARSWNVKKAEKMLRETIKWRASFKPEELRWKDVEEEAVTGKVYRANFVDKTGRTVLVMRPANQNTNNHDGQIRHLVYSLENAIINLPADEEQMVWFIDFKGWTLRKAVSVHTTREVAYVLQNMYPERLCIAILFNPPSYFETFWNIVKPFLDTKTANKVKFVHTKNKESLKIVEEYFNLDDLELSLGGRNPYVYDNAEYSKQMKVDDAKTAKFWKLEESSDPGAKSSAQEKEPTSKDKTGKKASKTSKVNKAVVNQGQGDTAVTSSKVDTPVVDSKQVDTVVKAA